MPIWPEMYFFNHFKWTVMPHCYIPIITMWDEVSYLSITKTLALSNTNSHPLFLLLILLLLVTVYICISYFSCHFNKTPATIHERRRGLFWLSSKGYSPSYPGRHGMGDRRQLITLHPESEVRERWRLIFNWLSFFLFSFNLGPPTPGVVLLIFRVGLPFSVRPLWRSFHR